MSTETMKVSRKSKLKSIEKRSYNMNQIEGIIKRDLASWETNKAKR